VFLTLAGILVLAAAGLVWAAGWLIGRVWTEGGAVTMAAGKAAFVGVMHAVDAVNGHQRKSPAVVYTVQPPPEPVQPRPARPETPQRPPAPSKAQQIEHAKAAYVNADLIDLDDDPALLERRISAILGQRE
jgi:hypothetical protein